MHIKEGSALPLFKPNLLPGRDWRLVQIPDLKFTAPFFWAITCNYSFTHPSYRVRSDYTSGVCGMADKFSFVGNLFITTLVVHV